MPDTFTLALLIGVAVLLLIELVMWLNIDNGEPGNVDAAGVPMSSSSPAATGHDTVLVRRSLLAEGEASIELPSLRTHGVGPEASAEGARCCPPVEASK